MNPAGVVRRPRKRAVVSQSSPAARRRWPWILGAIVVVALGALAWLGLGLRSAASDIKAHASTAENELRSAQDALGASDVTAARNHVATARAEVDAAQQSAESTPVRVTAHMPVAGSAVDDLDHLISAAGSVVTATDDIVTLYSQVSAKGGSQTPLFSNGQIHLERLPAVSAEITAIDATLGAAQGDLDQVQATLPGTAPIAQARDSAAEAIAPIRSTLKRVNAALPLVPEALGATQPVSYLLAITNQGEMRASGGAPLSVALITFDKGRFSVPFKGQMTSFPELVNNHTWKGAPGSPWTDAQGNRTGRFTAANIHPDFHSAGWDLIGSWESAGQPPVAGVFTIDISAIAKILDHTGPIESPDFGTITGDNVAQKLLVEAYRQFATDQVARQQANQVVFDQLVSRVTSGEGLLGVIQGLGASAPGRHFQAYFSDPALEAQMHALGVDGSLGTPSGDRVAVFTTNSNASKVDVFIQRTVKVNATVRDDGSATVTQTIDLQNKTPGGLEISHDQAGYTTAWSGALYFIYRPQAAANVDVSVTAGFRRIPWFHGEEWIDDGYGRQMTQVLGTMKPHGSAVITMTYELPAGTFLHDGALVYTLHADPQSTLKTTNLILNVTGPDGTVHNVTEPIDRPLDIAVPLN